MSLVAHVDDFRGVPIAELGVYMTVVSLPVEAITSVQMRICCDPSVFKGLLLTLTLKYFDDLDLETGYVFYFISVVWAFDL